MANWIHTCALELARKLHGDEDLEVFETLSAKEFTEDPDWATNQRLEVSTRLDSVSRDSRDLLYALQ